MFGLCGILSASSGLGARGSTPATGREGWFDSTTRTLPAFAQPGVLFIGAWTTAEKKWLHACMKNLKAHGNYTTVVEPCAGAFAMTNVYRHVGWKPEQIQASDVGLFSAALGGVFSGRGHEDLEVVIDGDSLKLTGDPYVDAATILFTQAVLRMDGKAAVPHWNEHKRDLQERKEAHMVKLVKSIEQMDQVMHGIDYRPQDMRDHINEVADDPNALIFIAPPTYERGYEKFFDTKGRLVWNEPPYSVWSPDQLLQLAQDAEHFSAMLITLQMTAETGGCVHREALYARHERKGITTYIWTNKPAVVRERMGLEAVPRNSFQNVRLDRPILPPRHPLTPKTKVDVVPITSNQARYYKDLWLHRINPVDASWNFAVLLDGYVAGVGGYTQAHLIEDALLLFFSVGARHELRTTRLVMQLALLRANIDALVTPWVSAQSDRMVTVNLTKYPEAKQNRGIFKLAERRVDPDHGYRLLYSAPINDQATPGDTYRRWLQKEQQRLSKSASK
jgi:hypothetical protein